MDQATTRLEQQQVRRCLHHLTDLPRESITRPGLVGTAAPAGPDETYQLWLIGEDGPARGATAYDSASSASARFTHVSRVVRCCDG